MQAIGHQTSNSIPGADLRNEPHGIYCPWSTWAPAAEKASEALLKMQPNWLMIVEGIASANDCSGARSRPIRLSIPNRLVYSSHVYVSSSHDGSGQDEF
jgi:aryl-phospho-beta-D-glucosidase BglC (GH1 family)